MASNLPDDIVLLISGYLTFRGIVPMSGVCQQWRRALRYRPQAMNKLLTNQTRNVDDAIPGMLRCPLRRGTLELVPTWKLESGDPWLTDAKHVSSDFKGFIVHREGETPKPADASAADDGAGIAHFAYDDGMIAWQATPSTIVVDDLTNGFWDVFECPLRSVDIRLLCISREIAVLETAWTRWGDPDHRCLVYNLATGHSAQYRVPNGPYSYCKVKVQGHDVILRLQKSPNSGIDCMHLRMIQNDLGQAELMVIQSLTVTEGGDVFFGDSGGELYTVYCEASTVIVTGYRQSQVCSRYVTHIPKAASNGQQSGDHTPKCRRADKYGTWQLYSEFRFIPETKTSVFFNVASCRFHWRHIPDRLGEEWDDCFDQPVCWNGWAYDYDLNPYDIATDFSAARPLHVYACSDPLGYDEVCSGWASEDHFVHERPRYINLDRLFHPSLFTDDEFLVFPTMVGGGYCVMQLGEKRELCLKKRAHYATGRDQWALDELGNLDDEDGNGGADQRLA